MSSVVIHGHFYQPPREDPFLDEVETEPSAAPFHDWNQRIERECYRAVVAARVTSSDGRIERLVNTLESISFNFGPTLLEWMEREAKPTYEAILSADADSARRLGGHGNAIAQPYHHTILPLATRRDKRTEVRWGMEDFRRRYGREPEGMWLPETAVDDVELVAPTSWSCAHGVGRWKEDCGCRIDGLRFPSQAWRAPLRTGLEALATELHAIYEREAIRFIPDPWSARDDYGSVVASDAASLERFVASVATRARTEDDRVRARELLELERDALRMFTSCGWFFDDIGGIEPRQDLRYAARAIALAGPAAATAEAALLDTLSDAASNDRTVGTGRDVYLRHARPAFSAPLRHAATRPRANDGG